MPSSQRFLFLFIVWFSGLTFTASLTHAKDQQNNPTLEKLKTKAIGALDPRLSPDGKSIVFSWQGSLWINPLPNGPLQQLTSSAAYDIEPTWSPDGKRVAYIHSPPFTTGLLNLINVETKEAIPLPKKVIARGKLYFHPDGSQILANFYLPSKKMGLSWFHLKTGELSPLHSPPQYIRWHALSGDGTTVAYATTMDLVGQQTGNNGPQADLWKLPATGGQPQKIMQFPSRIYDLAWIGKKRELLVVSELGGVHNDVWKVPLDDPLRLMKKLTFGQGDEDRPSTDSSGKHVLYTDNHQGLTQLVLQNLDSKDRKVVHYSRPKVNQLRLSTIDELTTKPVTTRVVIKSDKQQYFTPLDALYRISIRDADCFFYCRGQCEVDLPPGTYQITVQRGFEYRPVHTNIKIDEHGPQEIHKSITVKRWINQPAKGWYSGENHIHANYGYGHWYNQPQTVLAQCAGENLNVCNLVVANSDTDAVFDREFFRGRPDRLSTQETILYWNQEFRSTFWGHMTLVNLKQLVEPIFTGFKNTTNPWDVPTNSDVALETHRHHGHTNYTHPFRHLDDPYKGPYSAKGIPVDVALGHIDSLDINTGYPTPLGAWYQFLNCGFHLPASAGTDCFLNRIRSRYPGEDRVYVNIDGPLNYQKWIAGLRAGRSFVTNGPMLEFQVNDKMAGTVIKLAQPGNVHLKATGVSQFPLELGELVLNGKVIAKTKPNKKGELVFDEPVNIEESGWIAFRVSGPKHADHHSYRLYAHSNPVYLEVADHPLDSSMEAELFLAWIDRLEMELHQRNRIPTPEQHEHVHNQLNRARAVYQKLIAK